MFPQYVPPNDTSVRFGAFLKQSLATGPEYVNDVRFIEEISKNSTLSPSTSVLEMQQKFSHQPGMASF